MIKIIAACVAVLFAATLVTHTAFAWPYDEQDNNNIPPNCSWCPGEPNSCCPGYHGNDYHPTDDDSTGTANYHYAYAYDSSGLHGPPACVGHSESWCNGYMQGYQDGQQTQNTVNNLGQKTVINVNAEKANVGSTQNQQGGPDNSNGGYGGGS